MEEKTLNKLEYFSVMEKVADFAVSPTAKSLIKQLAPSNDIAEINRLLSETSEAELLIRLNIYPQFNFDDISEAAKKAKILSPLTLRELLSVFRLLKTSRHAASLLLGIQNEKLQYLTTYASGIYQNVELENEIDRCILNEEELSDNASPELFLIRQKIKRTNFDIKDKLNSIIKSSTYAKYLQDTLVTIRNDRYVLPVKQEYKNNIQGLIHDQSSTGATVFIEPLAVVNLNNQLKEFLLSEKAEIDKIIAAFTMQIGKISDNLIENQQILAYIDSIYAKAIYADKNKCTQPIINSKGIIRINKGRHPLLDSKTVVPISISFGDTAKMVIITGPNTGGKTVSLKTVGLFCLLAYAGLFLPCEENTQIAVFDEIFCDIGDEQSIQQSLSTFSSHIKNINDILNKITSNSLVLFDELGAGTEPIEGSALALSIAGYVLKSGSRAVITTHYSQLKEFSITTAGVVSASMEFNVKTFEPTYKLVMGIPGSSNAIEIAKRLGLKQEIIFDAANKVSDDKKAFDKVILNAENLRQQYEKQLSELEQIKREISAELDLAKNRNKILVAERERLLSSSQTEAKRIVSSAKEEASELLQQLKEISKRSFLTDKDLFEARSIVKRIDDKKYDFNIEEDNLFEGSPIDIKTLQMGDKVYIKKLNTVATVSGLPKGNKIEVRFNNMVTMVKQGEAYNYVDASEPKQKVSPTKSQIRTAPIKSEINLLGQTVDEALYNVDKFLDDALMQGVAQVRIIHGRGTGKLKNGIHSYLRTNKNVAEYRLGNYNEGDSGVTIVTLK